MKRTFFSLIYLLLCGMGVKAQIICVHCFEQNEAVSPGATNMLLNGGFESTTCTPGWFDDCFCPNSTKYNCDLTNWTCTGGDELSYPSVFDTSLSIIPQGNNAAYLGNGNAFACSATWGDLVCLATDACETSGTPVDYPRSFPGYGEGNGVSLHQLVSGLTIGHTYVLEFWAGGEPFHNLLTEPSIFSVDVGFGRTFLSCKPTGQPDQLIGTRYLIVFVANTTSHQITFANWGHICDICTELVLDDVSLYPIEDLNKTVGECTSATAEVNASEVITAFPNPFSSQLTITTKSLLHSDLNLYDITARSMFHQKFVDRTVINTSQFAGGIYFYEIRDANGRQWTGKIVKE